MVSFLSRSPIRIKLLIYFVPIMILSVVLTGVFSYLSAVKQLEKNAYYLLNDTVEQTGVFIDDKFHTMFEQLVIIENNNAFRNIMENKGQTVDERRYDDIINLRRQFEESYQNHFQMIDSIFVTFNNGRSFNLQKDFVPRHVGINLNEWMKHYSRSVNETGYSWLNQHVDTVFDTVETRSVLSLFKTIGNTESEVSGVVLINMREAYILNIMRNVKVSPNGILALISPDGVMYSKPSSSGYTISDEVINNIRMNAETEGSLREVSTSNNQMMIRYTTISLNKWKLAAIVPESDILSNASQIKSIVLYIVLIILVVFSIVATLFANSLSRPIHFLSKQVKSVRQGDLNVNFQLKERNEIGVLANGLQSLVDSVRELLQTVKDEQEQKRQIELLALQAQIQPHFLYNTLGSLKHLIDLGEKEKATTMVSALTHFFRIGISKGREVISVSEEIEHVRNYLLIQNIRYSKDFEFEIEIDECFLHLPIMKLTLQPLVENAIYHGIKKKRGRGIIRISGRRQGNYAILEVFDDGVGMSREMLQQITASIHAPSVQEVPVTFGLRNVHKRLVLQFDSSCGLELESREGEYTVIKASIPFTNGGEHVAMYKMIIADDDEWIREGMKRNIPWDQEQITVIGVAEDGNEAWDLIQRLKPDILLSDIHMPFMDGLKLAELVKCHGLDTKVVFLTGYDDFSYAKQAIQLQVFDYIMKYEDNSQVLQTVVNACHKLDEERKVVFKEKKGQGLIANQFYSDLIAGVGNDETIERDCKLLDLSFCGSMFGMAVLSMDDVNRFLKPNRPEDLELLLFSIKNVCSEVLKKQDTKGCQVQVIQYNHRINLLLNFTAASLDQLRIETESIAETIIESIRQYLKIQVKIGIGSFGEGFRYIALSYEEAMIAVEMKGEFADQAIIFNDQFRHSNNSHQAILKKITDYIDNNYQNEDLDLKEVAKTVHITPSYVSTLFKKYNDVNFSDYIIRLRIEKAKELLIHTELKAYKIAESIGYPNTQYFSVLFKKYTGLPPIEYRQYHRS